MSWRDKVKKVDVPAIPQSVSEAPPSWRTRATAVKPPQSDLGAAVSKTGKKVLQGLDYLEGLGRSTFYGIPASAIAKLRGLPTETSALKDIGSAALGPLGKDLAPSTGEYLRKAGIPKIAPNLDAPINLWSSHDILPMKLAPRTKESPDDVPSMIGDLAMGLGVGALTKKAAKKLFAHGWREGDAAAKVTGNDKFVDTVWNRNANTVEDLKEVVRKIGDERAAKYAKVTEAGGRIDADAAFKDAEQKANWLINHRDTKLQEQGRMAMEEIQRLKKDYGYHPAVEPTVKFDSVPIEPRFVEPSGGTVVTKKNNPNFQTTLPKRPPTAREKRVEFFERNAKQNPVATIFKEEEKMVPTKEPFFTQLTPPRTEKLPIQMERDIPIKNAKGIFHMPDDEIIPNPNSFDLPKVVSKDPVFIPTKRPVTAKEKVIEFLNRTAKQDPIATIFKEEKRMVPTREPFLTELTPPRKEVVPRQWETNVPIKSHQGGYHMPDDGIKAEFIPGKEAVPSATVEEASGLKSRLYEDTPDEVWNKFKTSSEGGDFSQRQARGVKEEIERTANRVLPGEGDKIAALNEEMGAVLSAGDASSAQFLREAKRNKLISPVDMALIATNPLIAGAKKVGDVIKAPAWQTKNARRLYLWGDTGQKVNPLLNLMEQSTKEEER